jgi:hypothetical protein
MQPIGFRICIIVPHGYAHAACFSETALLLRHSLLSLGLDCDLTVNELARNRVNIVLGVNLLDSAAQLGDAPIVMYQLEQLSDTEGWFSAKGAALLSRAAAVWDYSPENISFLRQKGISATYVPLGYHPALRTIGKNPRKDIDVLFVGSLNDRRTEILKELQRLGLTVKVLFGVYGRSRDEYIGRSRIVVNIHYYHANIFEAVRVSYLLNNDIFVVSEDSRSYPWKGVPLPLVPYDKIPFVCEYWIRNYIRREETRKQVSSAFKIYYSMPEILSYALKQGPVSMLTDGLPSFGLTQEFLGDHPMS